MHSSNFLFPHTILSYIRLRGASHPPDTRHALRQTKQQNRPARFHTHSPVSSVAPQRTPMSEHATRRPHPSDVEMLAHFQGQRIIPVGRR